MALPPHSATISSTPLLTASSITLPPLSALTACARPSGWMKVIVVMMLSSRCERDRQAFEAAQRVVVAPLDRTADGQVGDLACQRRQQHLAFEAGDQLADTHVDAATEADMAAGA